MDSYHYSHDGSSKEKKNLDFSCSKIEPGSIAPAATAAVAHPPLEWLAGAFALRRAPGLSFSQLEALALTARLPALALEKPSSQTPRVLFLQGSSIRGSAWGEVMVWSMGNVSINI